MRGSQSHVIAYTTPPLSPPCVHNRTLGRWESWLSMAWYRPASVPLEVSSSALAQSGDLTSPSTATSCTSQLPLPHLQPKKTEQPTNISVQKDLDWDVMMWSHSNQHQPNRVAMTEAEYDCFADNTSETQRPAHLIFWERWCVKHVFETTVWATESPLSHVSVDQLVILYTDRGCSFFTACMIITRVTFSQDSQFCFENVLLQIASSSVTAHPTLVTSFLCLFSDSTEEPSGFPRAEEESGAGTGESALSCFVTNELLGSVPYPYFTGMKWH